MPLFSDPTPRIERSDSFCTVVSVGAESTTHTGKTGVVSWKGRNYGCTIIGSVAAGDKAHFIQTKDGHVWAIKAGSYYRSAYPKRPGEWAKKAPASLAILELMKGNPRDRVFQSGIIKSVGTNTATVNLRGKDVLLPTKFEGASKSPSVAMVEKSGICFDNSLIWEGSLGWDNLAPWPDWYFKESDYNLLDYGLLSAGILTHSYPYIADLRWKLPSIGFYSEGAKLHKVRVKVLTLLRAENYPSYSVESTRIPPVSVWVFRRYLGNLYNAHTVFDGKMFGTFNGAGGYNIRLYNFSVNEIYFEVGPKFQVDVNGYPLVGCSTFSEIEITLPDQSEYGDAMTGITIEINAPHVNRYFILGKNAESFGIPTARNPYVNKLSDNNYIINMYEHQSPNPSWVKNANATLEWK